MAYDGIQFGSRVDQFTERKLYSKVVDNVLQTPTYFSRLMGQGKPMTGKTYDITIDVVSDNQGEWFTGLETLNASAANTTIQLSYAQSAVTQPKVSIMLESFANQGSALSLDAFKYEKAAAELTQLLGSAVYGAGTGNSTNGLGNIVLDSGTIGGQARSAYAVLNATNTASGGTLTLTKMATLDDATSGGSQNNISANIGVTTPTVWSLYESLLQPTVRANYDAVGGDFVSVRGDGIVKRADMRGNLGFSSISYRGMPIIKDVFATSGVLFFLNERNFDWMGRSIVPDEYKGLVEKVSIGEPKAYEGRGAEAISGISEYNGFFYQKSMMVPNQAGTIARFYVIGQMVGREFRSSGKLTGITSV